MFLLTFAFVCVSVSSIKNEFKLFLQPGLELSGTPAVNWPRVLVVDLISSPGLSEASHTVDCNSTKHKGQIQEIRKNKNIGS